MNTDPPSRKKRASEDGWTRMNPDENCIQAVGKIRWKSCLDVNRSDSCKTLKIRVHLCSSVVNSNPNGLTFNLLRDFAGRVFTRLTLDGSTL
jgi:hypothetical protein